MNHLQELLRALSEGPRQAGALRARLGLSPATLGRVVAETGEVLRFGRGRATAYARIRTIPGTDRRHFPVAEMDEQGVLKSFGRLFPVYGRGYVHLLESGEGFHHEGLPWWLQDMAPQGFLGRAFARQLPKLLPQLEPLGENPEQWSDDMRLIVLASGGWHPPGNLIVAPAFTTSEIPPAKREDFPRLAARALAGETPGSSAGGEQPKFIVRLADENDPREVIVKFSWGETEETRTRRADLLVCEHLAAQVLDEAGFPAASTILHRAEDTTFLVVTRHDRTTCGRRGFVSLGALDDAFIGARQSWSHSAGRLADLGHIPPDVALQVRHAEAFARLIANSDRHLGNIAFLRSGLRITGLFPLYDMLPMALAPSREGRLPTEADLPSPTTGIAAADLAAVLPLAKRFQANAAGHAMISPNFREICARLCQT